MNILRILLTAALCAMLLTLPATGQTRFITLYTFTNGVPTGLTPTSGALYGVLSGAAPTGSTCGDIFELQPPAAAGGSWTETVLHSFAETNDGCYPGYDPIVTAGGVLYGLTLYGGAYGYGTFYELQPPSSPGGQWIESVLYSFAPGIGFPLSGLVPGPGGSFYVLAGGLFQLQPPGTPGGAWTGTVLYDIPGIGPIRALTAGPHGVLYGTSAQGGPGGLGQVFQLTPPAASGGTWTETVLHNFAYGGASAGNPNSLTLASDGTIYGTTYGYDLIGGAGTGSVFALTPPASPGEAWTYAVLRDFGGYHPDSPLLLRNGNLYGAFATDFTDGDVFEMQPPSTPGSPWTTTILHQFTGQIPDGRLAMGKNGTLYGMSQYTMGAGSGTVFAIATK